MLFLFSVPGRLSCRIKRLVLPPIPSPLPGAVIEDFCCMNLLGPPLFLEPAVKEECRDRPALPQPLVPGWELRVLLDVPMVLPGIWTRLAAPSLKVFGRVWWPLVTSAGW